MLDDASYTFIKYSILTLPIVAFLLWLDISVFRMEPVLLREDIDDMLLRIDKLDRRIKEMDENLEREIKLLREKMDRLDKVD